MKHEQCFQLGTIIKTIGKDGRLEVIIDVDQPSGYNKLPSVFIDINGKLVPFFVTFIKIHGPNKAYINLEDVDTAEYASKLIGADLYLPLSELPPLTGKKFYFHEIIGFSLLDKAADQLVGEIIDVLDNGPNTLLKAKSNHNEILIPLVRDWIAEVDRQNKVLIMNLPEGLIELNSNKKEHS